MTPEGARQKTEAYLTAQGWKIVRDTPDLATRLANPKVVRINWEDGESIATKTPMDDPAAAAVASSIGRTVGYPVLKLPIVGASSGMAKIVNALQVPMVGVSIANYDNNQHSVNENITLQALWGGIEVYAGLISDLTW
jgi:acetylornithine deacetylase/succinyl-diaminopimelate desuccinylase-like protein